MKESITDLENKSLDKYEFSCVVDDIFDVCKTISKMEQRKNSMIQCIEQMYILKSGLKKTMNEFEPERE